MNRLQRLITIFTIFLIVVLLNCKFHLSAQYVNPNYGGPLSSGFGESGAQLSGPFSGILNPASLFFYRPRVNLSISTGVFSDYLLFFPTLKDLSLLYPIQKQKTALRLYFGIPKDNNLRKYSDRIPLGNYEGSYTGGQRYIGASIVYRPPLNRLLTRRNYFDLRIGLDVAKSWGIVSSWMKNNVSKGDFWVDSYEPGSWYHLRVGSLLMFRRAIKFQLALSTVFQSSIATDFSRRAFEFYNLGFGVKYFLSQQNSKNIHVGIEVENPTDISLRKVGLGIQYNFTNMELNSVEGGVFTYPKNVYDIRYNKKPLFWYTLGFAKTIHNWIITFSLSDALNLDLSSRTPPSKDIAKIISVGLSIPLTKRIIPIARSSINSTVEFLDLNFNKRKILIGKGDTLSFFIQHIGEDPVENPKIYFNVEPKTGIVLLDPYIELPDLKNKDFMCIDLPIRSIAGIPGDNFTITANLAYGRNNTVVKHLEIETTEPILEVITHLTGQKRYWFFEIPGSYILELYIKNYGNHTSDSLTIYLPNKFVELGFVSNSEYHIGPIKPNSSKKVKITLNTSQDNFPPKMPITINFREGNGFDPFPIYADFIMWSTTQISLTESWHDPFINNFKGFEKFYAILNLEWQELQKLKSESTFILREDPNFPGKLVIGPYENIYDILAIRYTLDMLSQNYELVALEKHRFTPLKRYFYIIENTTENKQILAEINRLPYYQDVQQSSKLLIGPFYTIKTIDNLEVLIQEFFSYYQVVTRYPNQVVLEEKNGKPTNVTSDERMLGE